MKAANEKEYIAYSKCIIKNIIPISKWKVRNLTTLINFPAEAQMVPPTFNYYDYISAWRQFLLIRPCSHSWFFQIKTEVLDPIPRWFFL